MDQIPNGEKSMDWALDQLGRLIQASEPGIFSYTFVCPTCGEPVRRRSGQERRSHFAHFSYSAKPECELYHPSSGQVTLKPGVISGTPQSLSSRRLIQGGLYLERTEIGTYSLYLRLPQLLDNNGSVGEIEIRSGLGEHVYSGAQLERARYIRIMPRLPLAEAIGSDDLAVLAITIKLHISRFRPSNNFFRANEESGKLLAPDEPLEWGERYRLVTQSVLGSMPTDFKLDIEHSAAWSGWHYYEIGLPPFDQVGGKAQWDAISQCLHRSIIAPRARAFFVYPPAHHIEPDGTYVFPETTEKIIVRRIGERPTSITINTRDTSAAKVINSNNEWCEISGLGQGDFVIYIEGREVLHGRLEKSELFHPIGVRLSVGGQTWEIFEPGLQSALVTTFHENLGAECPSVRVAEYLADKNNAAISKGTTLTVTEAQDFLLFDGRNFGSISGRAADLRAMNSPIIDQHKQARRLWIEGLVARHCGPDGVAWLRAQWNDKTCPLILGTTNDPITCFQPHIQFARSQEE
jgi:hypothetical protein